MLLLDGNIVPGTEEAQLTSFGETAVHGVAEIADTQRNLGEDRFNLDNVIPIIGEESMVRIIGFAPKTEPDLFDHIRRILPSGLITFGVGSAVAAAKKPGGTHLDILLREWGWGNGPRGNDFLGIAIGNVYSDDRTKALRAITASIGSRAVTLSRAGDDFLITS
jgi:hypothetical protein